jgi:hypothetical protein
MAHLVSTRFLVNLDAHRVADVSDPMDVPRMPRNALSDAIALVHIRRHRHGALRVHVILSLNAGRIRDTRDRELSRDATNEGADGLGDWSDDVVRIDVIRSSNLKKLPRSADDVPVAVVQGHGVEVLLQEPRKVRCTGKAPLTAR